jgi:micrococcal nuclease
MRFLCVLTIFAFLLSPSLVCAEETVMARGAFSGDEISLTDGRILRLIGIWAALPEAKAFLESAVSGQTLRLQDEETDRYGRLTATILVEGEKKPVEEALLRAGMAFVYSAANDERFDAWYEAERAARIERRGFWATPRAVPALDAAKLSGKYGFVVGVVSKAERIRNKATLSFGAPDRPDFKIIIAAKHLRPLKKRGFDLLSLGGKSVRVRGWVTDNLGPTITLTAPHQLEWME